MLLGLLLFIAHPCVTFTPPDYLATFWSVANPPGKIKSMNRTPTNKQKRSELLTCASYLCLDQPRCKGTRLKCNSISSSILHRIHRKGHPAWRFRFTVTTGTDDLKVRIISTVAATALNVIVVVLTIHWSFCFADVTGSKFDSAHG